MTKRRTSSITAAELRAQLDSDSAFQAKKRKEEAARALGAASRKKEEEPILADLREIGFNLQTVWDLVPKKTYPEAIPILEKHLLLPYSDRIREGIARALATPEARSAWPLLVSEYIQAPAGSENGVYLGAKDALAVALSVLANDAVIEDVVTLARNRSLGESRIMLLKAIKRSKSPIAVQALKDLSSDPDLKREIASWSRPKGVLSG